MPLLTTEDTEARIRGTLKAARNRPSGIQLASAHVPYVGIIGAGYLEDAFSPTFHLQFKGLKWWLSHGYDKISILRKLPVVRQQLHPLGLGLREDDSINWIKMVRAHLVYRRAML